MHNASRGRIGEGGNEEENQGDEWRGGESLPREKVDFYYQ